MLKRASEFVQKYRKAIWNATKILLGLSLFGVFLSKINLEYLSSLLGQISYPWLIAYLLAYYLMFFVKALQYHYLLKKQVTYWQAFQNVIAQSTIANFTVSALGMISSIALFRAEQGVKVKRSIIVLLIIKSSDMIAIGAVLLFLNSQLAEFLVSINVLINAVLIGIGLIFATLLIVIILRRQLFRWMDVFLGQRGWRGTNLANKALEVLSNLAGQTLTETVASWGGSLILSLAYLLCTLAWAYCAICIFTGSIGFLEVSFVNVMLQLLSLIPVQVFGGLGVNDVTGLYLYSLFGMETGEMGAIMLGVRALFILSTGTILLFWLAGLWTKKGAGTGG